MHGGRAVVAAVLGELGRLIGFRHAEPGEFTKRAFINGQIDLTGAEALADLIGAETESQRQLALENASGGQHDLYEGWRKRLLHARAMIEAELDFADEGDVPGSVSYQIWQDMSDLVREIGDHLAGFSRAEMIRDGVSVVLIGAPNSGKSTLLNALARRDVAIVSEEPGTTRDLIEVSLDLQGMKVVLTDTAGIRESEGRIEAAGIARALARANRAHLILLVEDTFDPVEVKFEPGDVPMITIGTKTDLAGAKSGRYDNVLSVVDGSGVQELLERLTDFAGEAGYSQNETLPSRLRHVQHLTECGDQIGEAIQGVRLDIELRAEHLRRAADALARITGRVDVEELLGSIFSEFCIGK